MLIDDNDVSFKGKNVIIIDDDEGIRFLWRRKIKLGGGNLLWEADSGWDVLNDKFEIKNIDLALVDYSYPDTDITGVDVIKYLKVKGIAEVHLCTGHFHDEEICKEAISAGANSIIPKR